MRFTEEKLFLSLSRRESETVIGGIFKLLIRWWSISGTQIGLYNALFGRLWLRFGSSVGPLR
jgi:hypothetical protein